MKRISLAVLSLAALVFGRPAGFSTANAQSDDIAALKAQADTLATQLASQEDELKKLRAATSAPRPPDEVPTGIALLCKGAGVPLEDVTWRVQAGLDPEQAVEAAIAQKQSDAKAKKK